MHFGEHVTLDGYGGSARRLDDPAVVTSCLEELCRALKMRVLYGPCVVAAPDNRLRDPGGWSGFLVIAESHISIHTFPKRRFLSADVYSCQNGIEVAFITDCLTTRFCLEEVETHFIKRGTKYPEKNVA
ncbi:MAG: S-adenosylmethionine decarboxylase [Alphaproteobacteria bacterium]|nr:S-adenosylmethionine decarboxylase [Alphaproteobacteria bacterium]